ncbi:MAG: hypothetical protein AB7P04_12130 [Bacteriovoracia bacterium]
MPRKTMWKGARRKGWTFYCPQCSGVRKVPLGPRPEAGINAFRIALTAGVFTVATWPWFGWKGMISLVPFWAIFETYYRLRLRTSLACPNCGFDPYLFLVDAKKARTEMVSFWKEKFAKQGIPYPGDEENNLTTATPSAAGSKTATTQKTPKNPQAADDF